MRTVQASTQPPLQPCKKRAEAVTAFTAAMIARSLIQCGVTALLATSFPLIGPALADEPVAILTPEVLETLERNGDESETIEIRFEVEEVYGNTFKGRVMLVNTGDRPIRGWALDFTTPYPIREFWNAEVVTSDSGHYSIRNARYNQTITPGQTVDFGFIGYSPSHTFAAPELLDISVGPHLYSAASSF